MVPVYQTIFNTTNGNCVAAIVASMLHLNIEDVPNFVETDDYWKAYDEFMLTKGYEYNGYLINPSRPLPEEEKQKYEHFRGEQLPSFGDINGCYDATVFSPGYFDAEKYKNDPDYKPVTHAILVDRQFNIVHDPNPKYKGIKYPLTDELGYNGILGVSLWGVINITKK